MLARFTISDSGVAVHGFEPTDTLVRNVELDSPTLYVDSGYHAMGM